MNMWLKIKFKKLTQRFCVKIFLTFLQNVSISKHLFTFQLHKNATGEL